MPPTTAEIEEALRGLRRTPQQVRRLTAERSEADLRRRPDATGWSANEVLAHLRGAADVRGAWIRRMLDEDDPTIRYASPRTGMRRGGYAEHPFGDNLRAFSQQRADLVHRLAALPPDGWSRRATFTGTPKGWNPSVHDLVADLVTHELAHFAQLAES